MEDQRFGALIRAVRVKRGLTQRQLARLAGVSDGSVSRLERGLVDSMSLATIRAIARVLDVRVELLPRSRAAEADRVVAGTHAALAEAVITWLAALGGWIVRPEVGFSIYGERGVIDLACWHPVRRALLIIELKTELVDISALLATLDRYVRHAGAAVAPMGWHPLSVARLLIVGDSGPSRARVHAHAALFAAALPDRVKAVRAWLRDPVGQIAGLMFFTNRHPTSTNRRLATVRRVRPPRTRVAAPSSSSPDHEFAAASRQRGR